MITCAITECCVYNSVSLTTAASSNTAFAGSPAPSLVSFDSTAGIKVDFAAYTTPAVVTLYFRSVNSLSQLATKYSQLVTINIVCGYEVVSMNSGESDPGAVAKVLDRAGYNTTYTWTGFQSFFSSDVAVCPVTAITIFSYF